MSHISRRSMPENGVLDSVPSLIWVLNRENKFTFVNKSCAAFLGIDAGNLIGKPLNGTFDPLEAKKLLKAAGEVFGGGRKYRLEAKLEDQEHRLRWMDIVLTPVFNNQQEVCGVTFTASDVTKHKLNEEKLKYFSMHDQLTGLYNRLYFEEEIRRLNAERHYPISIIVCDVDGLKFVNDVMGHGQGDELLKIAAKIIRKPFRSSDVVARVGGDEFAVILPSTGEDIVEKIATRLQKTVEKNNKKRNNIPLSLSIGFATGNHISQKIMEIYNLADDNMYKNKYERGETAKRKIIDYLLSNLRKKDFRDDKYEERLQCMSLLLGQAIGLSFEDLRCLLQLARVHEIGKIKIDESILLKKGVLSEDEWKEVKRHPETGYHIARGSEELAPVAEYILQHHEYWDGGGYPKGLKGREIHLYSRIMAIVEAYEAMTTPRPYRKALPLSEAINELEKNSGSKFDPRLTDIFISLIEDVEKANTLEGIL